MLSTNIIKLPWETGCLSIFFFFFFYECLGIQLFNSLTCDLRDDMPRQRSLRLLTHMWLTGRHATPEVSFALFPTQPFLPWVLRIWESVFYSQVFFTLHSFLLLSRPLWGRQFNLKVTRVSCWSSKHILRPAICFNHNSPENGL